MRERLSVNHKYKFADESFSGCPTYLFTYIVWKEDDMIHECQQSERTFDLDSLVPQSSMPARSFWPKLPSSLVPLSLPLPPDSFVKSTPYGRGAASLEEASAIAECTLQEVTVWESILRHHPHPNVCEYRGVVSEDGEHITGIVFKKYEITLDGMMREWTEVEIEEVMRELRRAVEHLHSIGLIHGDINPSNIMISSSAKPGSVVLIDFDTCEKEGGARRGGTPGYMKDYDDRVAKKEFDWYALECVEDFLRKGRTKVRFSEEEKDKLWPKVKEEVEGAKEEEEGVAKVT